LNVLSLFDGMSCGQIALERAGIKVDTYYASEIDKYAIQITQKNYPGTIQLGDINNINLKQFDNIDLLIGGSPCQDLSIAKKDRQGINGSKSGLFWKYIEALKSVKPKYFLFENVASMKKIDRDIISKELGVQPISINSSLVSALNRERLYWTNIPNIIQPENKNIYVVDILQDDLEIENKYYLTDIAVERLVKINIRAKEKGLGYKDCIIDDLNNSKFLCLDANYFKGADGKRSVILAKDLRMATPVECERLQTLPDNYTEGVSNTQRYKMLGNGWTVDVIAHIFKYILK